VVKRRQRGTHRRRRLRRPMTGTLLHIDGSKHCWFKNSQRYDLIVILDDATSEFTMRSWSRKSRQASYNASRGSAEGVASADDARLLSAGTGAFGTELGNLGTWQRRLPQELRLPESPTRRGQPILA